MQLNITSELWTENVRNCDKDYAHIKIVFRHDYHTLECELMGK